MLGPLRLLAALLALQLHQATRRQLRRLRACLKVTQGRR